MSPPSDRPLTAIALKLISVTIFVAMSSFIKASGEVPAGQIVFFRSFFAILPLLVFFIWAGELGTGWKTDRPFSHMARGLVGTCAMALGFFALTRLPLPEAIALSYAQPLLVVAFSALILGEHVRLYRWTAVIVGLIGVVIISWPKLTLAGAEAHDAEFLGVVAALLAAAASAIAMLLVRSLVASEKSATVVLWFSITASVLSLLSIPFGWNWLTVQQAMLLILAGIFGGIAQVFMTEAYRYGEASTVAPFEYSSLILGLIVGYFAFGDRPTVHMVVGGAIVIASGVFIVWRERKLGLERGRARKVSPPQ